MLDKCKSQNLQAMKNLIFTLVFLFSAVVFAQKSTEPVFEEQGNLIKATFYHDNGEIAQQGFYKNQKPHGEWKAFDITGKKIAVATYKNGVKTGKWFFWNADKLSEVDYKNNEIVTVTRWENANSIVLNR